MTSPLRTPLALVTAALVLGAISSCSTSARCGVPGVVTTCVCPNGTSGARLCGEDNVWQRCDCDGAIGLPNAITNDVMPGGAGGTMATPTGGSGPTVVTEDDAGAEPAIDAGGTGGVSGAGATGATGGVGATGGTGGAGATGGTGGVEPMPPNPYRACMQNPDCDAGAACVVTPGFVTATVCAPACIDVGDCPVPDGSYQATVRCDAGYCKIDCTPLPFAPLLTCPTGMVCIAPLFGISHCHDDGV